MADGLSEQVVCRRGIRCAFVASLALFSLPTQAFAQAPSAPEPAYRLYTRCLVVTEVFLSDAPTFREARRSLILSAPAPHVVQERGQLFAEAIARAPEASDEKAAYAAEVRTGVATQIEQRGAIFVNMAHQAFNTHCAEAAGELATTYREDNG